MEQIQEYKSQGLVSNELSPGEVLVQVKMIQELMSKAMKDGEHYGKIPGCGDKPTLLKAGAEKLTFMFRLAPKYEVIEKSLSGDHREYKVITELIHINSKNLIGQGVGVCSTMETKYRFRNSKTDTGESIPKDYKERKEEYRKQGLVAGKDESGKWKWFRLEKIEYENPADHYNTVLKMAKKRSLVDATLTATAASDIFTQDIEELVENGVIMEEAKHSEIKEEQKPHNQEAAEMFRPDNTDPKITDKIKAAKTKKELSDIYASLSEDQQGNYVTLLSERKAEIEKKK